MSLRTRVDDPHRQGNGMMVAVFLLVSLPCLLGAGYMLLRSFGYVLGAERAQGHIVEISGDTPTLTVEYRTASGQTRRVRSFGSDLYANYAAGDAVGVYYLPQQPAAARLDLFAELWMLPMILGLFGSFFFVPVLMMGGEVLRSLRMPARRVDLDRQGQLVQAEYTGFRLTLDASALRARPGGVGSVSLASEGGQHRLIDNGRARDPLDPVVQRELGLRYVVQAQWTDPLSGRSYAFESEPQPDNPERRVRAGRVSLRLNPKNPAQYRFEPPFGPAQATRSAVIE